MKDFAIIYLVIGRWVARLLPRAPNRKRVRSEGFVDSCFSEGSTQLLAIVAKRFGGEVPSTPSACACGSFYVLQSSTAWAKALGEIEA